MLKNLKTKLGFSTMAPIFSSKLFSVQLGQATIVTATSKKSTDVFEIDLSHANGDIALHMSVSLRKREFLRNSYQNGRGWMQENFGGNLMQGDVFDHLKAGKEFKITVYITKNTFIVAVNDQPYCTFNYRLSPTDITEVFVKGALKKVKAAKQITSSTPDFKFVNFPKSFRASIVSLEPFSFNPLGRTKIKLRDTFTVLATAREHATFSIRLLNSKTKKIFLTHSACFETRKFVINGTEHPESDGKYSIPPESFPYPKNITFKLEINLHYKFKIFINECKLMELKY